MVLIFFFSNTILGAHVLIICGALVYRGWTRLDLGFGNPNKAGALLAILALLVWLPAFWKPATRWFCGAFSALAAGLLCHTFSRGALVALVVGGAATLGVLRPRWPRRYYVLMGCGLCALAGYAAWCGLGERTLHGAGGTDRSVTSRAEMYRKLPAMLAAAPGGWGRGQAAAAYENWFQPMGESTRFKHLLSTHGTWAVEYGWAFSFGYGCLWIGAFGLCWRHDSQDPRWFSICAGSLAAFFTAACFSHIAESPVLALAPVLATLAVVIVRSRQRSVPALRFWLIAAAASAVFVGALVGLGIWNLRGLPIHHRRGLTVVGHGPPQLWILRPDTTVLGHNYGQAVRSAIRAEHPRIPAVAVLSALPRSLTFAEPVLITGSFPEIAALHAPRIVWLNPRTEAAAQNAAGVIDRNTDLTIVWGSLRNDESLRAWRQRFADQPHIQFRHQPGVALYVPDFLHKLFVALPPP